MTSISFIIHYKAQFSSVQSLSHVWLFATPWTAACQASLSITNSRSLPKLMTIELAMPSNHLILCRPLLLLPSIFPNIRVFSNESVLRIRWPRYWSFSFSISPSNEYSGPISFRIDWFDLLAVQGIWNSNTLAIWCKELTHWKRLWCWERLKVEGEGMTEDEMVGWHHQLDRCEFEQALGVGDGQGGLACCSSWGCKESDMTKWLNWQEGMSEVA